MTFLVRLALGWCLGVWLAAQVAQPLWVWGLLALSASIAAWAWRANSSLRGWALFALALSLGGGRYQHAQPNFSDPHLLAHYNDHGEVTLEGVVLAEPDARADRTLLRVQVDTLLLPGASHPMAVQGWVLFTAPRFSTERFAATEQAEWRYGDRVRVFGPLVTPPATEDFSYRDYLARAELYSQVRPAEAFFLSEGHGELGWQVLLDFKLQAQTTLLQLFPEPHAALLTGILLGVDAGLPRELTEAFSLTGTSHIIAISGFNIAIIAGVFAALAKRVVGARWGWLIAVAGIALYAVLVGLSASVVRAAIMGSLGIIAQQFGRQGAKYNTLAAAVMLMTAQNPMTLWDPGFQLSAGATFGLMRYAEPLQNFVGGLLARFFNEASAKTILDIINDSLLLTSAAQITTLPLIVYQFKRLSLISLLANFIILPVQPTVMLAGGVALILGLVAKGLRYVFEPFGLEPLSYVFELMSQLAAWVTWPFTAYTLAFVEFFARWPLASLTLGAEAGPVAISMLLATVALTAILSRPPTERPPWWQTLAKHWNHTLALSLLAMLSLVVWRWGWSLPDPAGRLRVTVLEVGQGDAVLVQTPSGVNVVIDGGPTRTALARALARQLPLFTTHIDLMVVAAPNEESLGGLPDVLARYTVRQTLLTSATAQSAAYAQVRQTLTTQEVPQTVASPQLAIDLGDGVTLRVVADTPSGSVLRLEWQRFSMLLPVALKTSDEAKLLKDGLAQPTTALLLAQHGADTANHPAWLAALNPQVVLVALDAANPPVPSVLQTLAGRMILRTDEHGDVQLQTDGVQLWVETAR